MTDRLWILGADDPEMEAIESLLRECGERVAYALDERLERVRPGSAYRGIAHRYAVDCGQAGDPDETWYLVECQVPTPAGNPVVRVDHHRPGDPGFGRPPSEFLEASSLGQVIAELARLGALSGVDHYVDGWAFSFDAARAHGFDARWLGRDEPASGWSIRRDDYVYSIPLHVVLTAAADHCLGAAYRGECPGVDPDALMRWRVESRARFQGRSPEEVLADVERAREALCRAPMLALDGASPRRLREEGCPVEASRALCVRDMRGVCTAHHMMDDCGCATQQCVASCGAYSHGPCSVPELPDAASRDGEAYLATVSVDGSGRPCRPKIVLGGATTPEMVRAFIEHWAPAHGLVDCYGDPERGFAGGYLPGLAREGAS